MVLDRYSVLSNYTVQATTVESEVKSTDISIVLDDTSKLITLSDMSPITKDYITVHKLSDYRRTGNSILLIPDVKATIDLLLFDRKEASKCIPTL